VAEKLDIPLGGWHDFTHTLTTTMRRNGVHPKVISSILGHLRVNLAMDTYDRTTTEDLRQPLAEVASQLLPMLPTFKMLLDQTIQNKGMVGLVGFEPTTKGL
jgi:hypothetical protein